MPLTISSWLAIVPFTCSYFTFIIIFIRFVIFISWIPLALHRGLILADTITPSNWGISSKGPSLEESSVVRTILYPPSTLASGKASSVLNEWYTFASLVNKGVDLCSWSCTYLVLNFGLFLRFPFPLCGRDKKLFPELLLCDERLPLILLLRCGKVSLLVMTKFFNGHCSFCLCFRYMISSNIFCSDNQPQILIVTHSSTSPSSICHHARHITRLFPDLPPPFLIFSGCYKTPPTYQLWNI